MKYKIPKIRDRKEYMFLTLPFATFPYLVALAEEKSYELTYIIPAGTRSYDTGIEGKNVWLGQKIGDMDTMRNGEGSDWLRPLQLEQSIMLTPHGKGRSLSIDAKYINLEDVIPEDVIAEYHREQAERNANKDFYYLNIDQELIFVKARVNQKDLLKANGILWQMEEEIPLIEAFPETGENAYKVLMALNYCIQEAYPGMMEPMDVLRDPICWEEKLLAKTNKKYVNIGFMR